MSARTGFPPNVARLCLRSPIGWPVAPVGGPGRDPGLVAGTGVPGAGPRRGYEGRKYLGGHGAQTPAESGITFVDPHTLLPTWHGVADPPTIEVRLATCHASADVSILVIQLRPSLSDVIRDGIRDAVARPTFPVLRLLLAYWTEDDRTTSQAEVGEKQRLSDSAVTCGSLG